MDMDAHRGSSPIKTSAPSDSPEHLIDVFKTAALSVTKLYKASAAAQTKARSDGYQDCVDDLLAYLDKHNIGLGDGDGWKIRRWATERLDGRDTVPTVESDDESERIETDNTTLAAPSPEAPVRTESAPPPTTIMQDDPAPATMTVPTQENFTFQSSVPYPTDSDLNMANLDLSDSRGNDNTIFHHSVSQSRLRNTKGNQRPRPSGHVTRSAAGQKRKNVTFEDFFDIESIGGKDVFGGGGKRGRHT